ncbi:hypothetical protein PHAVU_007G070200 [Phaseolus vulgaris]|uniref:Uncharacterized protein n=1 Tax=Phaseolus vulgaris TaxID=3885 RepID=V7BET5_PHAVU|nr:hypothetical protein PHAVU_007G070200g [Phaseolus vulgaris]ESW15408.1 hypothetical protein PHAVU_007G070200g [Phaseolus vulgaris]
MIDEKTKKKAIEAAADIYDEKEQKLTVVSEMDAVAVVKKLKKVEESREGRYNISWTCQGREERRKERGRKE